MPGPFPGMDPYLENPLYWRGVHHAFISEAMAALNLILPPGFFAAIDERLYVLPPQNAIYQDITVGHFPGGHPPQHGISAAVVERDHHTIVITANPENIREGFIEIRVAGGAETPITVIEVLSPTNKSVGSLGWSEYKKKQDQLLLSDTNLLEVDLLRSGTHQVAAPIDQLQQFAAWDYLTCLHRPENRYTFECIPFKLSQSLPVVNVPIGPGRHDVQLDLQTVLERVYDTGRYRDRISYSDRPVPPLSVDDSEWANALLCEKGLRA